MEYKEEQIGWLITGAMIFFIFLMLVFYLLQIGSNPIPLSGMVIFIIIAIIVILMFYKLTVVIDKNHLKVIFGIGLIRKKFRLDEIKTVNKTRSKWYNGWGIRLIKKGMLYNIQGFNAVELSFKNNKRRVLIGTKSNSKLEAEIKKRIDNKK